VKIGKYDLDREILVIAEIGNNHEGDPETALRMVEKAVEVGISAVKIQIIDPERLVNISQQNRIAQLKKFRLPWSIIEEMAVLAHKNGMLFIASAFDIESLGRMSPVVDVIKIASGDLDFFPLLKKAAGIGKPLMLSTGMSSLDEIKHSVDIISAGLPERLKVEDSLVLLHCVSLYPAPFEKANLRAIETLRREFGLTVGYSDHTLGIEASMLSMMLGARVIEKHFTLDKGRTSFHDHSLSADSEDMRKLVEVARGLMDLLGDGKKTVSADEQAVAAMARRSIVAARDLSENAVLTAEDLDYVRPRDGMAPGSVDRVLGRRLRVALKRHDVIREENLG
jgi:N,N'-diacetyllegionaminate synthase